jgi:hypothetical protein
VATNPLRIAKAMRQVSMWVHPEGLVKGAIFVAMGEDQATQEDPRQVLNADKPFLVLCRENPDEIRFYNRAAIVRVEYDDESTHDEKATVIPCRIELMDGSALAGEIIEILPADHARLYDYLNQSQERFIRVFTSANQVCMVNKNYIIKVTGSEAGTDIG